MALPITTAIFNQRLVSSTPLVGGGKAYALASETEIGGSGQMWILNFNVPNNSQNNPDYGNGEIVIVKGKSSNAPYYTYSTEGEVRLRNLPDGLKQRIVDDFNTLAGVEEVRPEDNVEWNKQSVVKTEEAYGHTVTLTKIENYSPLQTTSDIGKTIYQVSGTQDGVGISMYSTLAEAETRFQYLIGWASRATDQGSITVYNGITIDFDTNQMDDGSSTGVNSVAIYGDNFPREEFVLGDEVKYIDVYGRRDFGVISGAELPDTLILQAYIDERLSERDDPTPFILSGLIEVMSFGWYNNFLNKNSDHNPFSKVDLDTIFTLSNTEGRILALTDSDVWGYDSGAVFFTVKEGYRVRFKLMTQKRDYFKESIADMNMVVSHTQYDIGDKNWSRGDNLDYTNTDKITFDMYGGDSMQIDIDETHDSVATFSITSNGVQLVKGSPEDIDDETFLAIIEVEKDVVKPEGSGNGLPVDLLGDESETEEESKYGSLGLIIGAIAIGIILYVALKNNSTGREEE